MQRAHTSTQIIAKEGWMSIGIAFALFLVSVFLGVLPWVFLLLCVVLVFLFRNPERIAEEEDALVIIAPTDGTVRTIEKSKTLEGEPCLRVVIENSLLDVGVLRAPFALEAESVRRRHGLFLPVSLPKSALLNEQLTFTCKGHNALVQMRILAGVFARNLTLFLPKKQFKLGERLGYFNEGAVELFLPLHVRIRVTLGQSVKAGQSVLGYFKGAQ